MDIRNVITQQRIKDGFFRLLKERNLAQCKIADIIEYAGISKKTFYSYYHNKDELLTEVESELASGLAHALAKDRTDLTTLDHVPDETEIAELANNAFDETIDFCNKYKVQFSRLLSRNGDINFYKEIINIGVKEFNLRFPYLFSDLDDNDKSFPLNFICTIYVQDIVSILVLWGKDSDSFRIKDIKKLIGIVQTKSPVELVGLALKTKDS